jgi:spore germination cell wall hydrolase CwlJ-like protein
MPATFASEFLPRGGNYFEARGESAPGQMAVGRVIINRANNPAYPRKICDVVNQNASRQPLSIFLPLRRQGGPHHRMDAMAADPAAKRVAAAVRQ